MRHSFFPLGFVAALIIGACAPPPQLPFLPRPDTRRIVYAEMDSTVVRQIATTFADSLPNETGVCLTLEVSDVPGAPHPVYAVTVVRSDPAAIVAATPFSVWYAQQPYRNGCASTRQFAIGHSHPRSVAPFECTHSNQDAIFLASDPRLLFTLVFCGDGRGEVMWQDGRRHPLRWLPDSAEAP